MDRPRSSRAWDSEPGTQPSPRAGDLLGDRLRQMFDSVEATPVPDTLTRLVAELEAKRRAG